VHVFVLDPHANEEAHHAGQQLEVIQQPTVMGKQLAFAQHYSLTHHLFSIAY